MPTRGKLVSEGVIRGDKYTISRAVRLQPGVELQEAWLTVKADPSTEADAAAAFQKDITSANTANVGWIEDIGTDGYALMHFDMTDTDSLALTADVLYFYDIQILTTDGDIETIEIGSFIPIEQVTRDS